MMDRKFQKSQSMVPFVQYTQDELIRITEALDKQLGPEFISKRKGPGYNSIQYLEGWKAINLANNIFGPNGWCTELKNFQVDYIDERGGSISMGLSAIVRVSLKDGTFHEDIGYGSIDNCRTKSAAFDKCKKEAVTDGMKRALRQFGNALGNCLYDKDFLSKITKVKQPPKNFDEENLMRVSVKKEKPDLNIASTNKLGASKDTATIKSSAITKRVGPTRSSQAASDDSFMFSDDWPEELSQKDDFAEKPIPDSEPEHDISNDNVDNNKNSGPSTMENNSTKSSIPANVTFVAAKSAESILKDPSLQTSLKYDPSKQSQISKSTFINHARSGPVKKSTVSAFKKRDDNKENSVLGNRITRQASSSGKRLGLSSNIQPRKRMCK